jgi:hypothetical protein
MNVNIRQRSLISVQRVYLARDEAEFIIANDGGALVYCNRQSRRQASALPAPVPARAARQSIRNSHVGSWSAAPTDIFQLLNWLAPWASLRQRFWKCVHGKSHVPAERLETMARAMHVEGRYLHMPPGSPLPRLRFRPKWLQPPSQGKIDFKNPELCAV